MGLSGMVPMTVKLRSSALCSQHALPRVSAALPAAPLPVSVLRPFGSLLQSRTHDQSSRRQVPAAASPAATLSDDSRVYEVCRQGQRPLPCCMQQQAAREAAAALALSARARQVLAWQQCRGMATGPGSWRGMTAKGATTESQHHRLPRQLCHPVLPVPPRNPRRARHGTISWPSARMVAKAGCSALLCPQRPCAAQ